LPDSAVSLKRYYLLAENKSKILIKFKKEKELNECEM